MTAFIFTASGNWGTLTADAIMGDILEYDHEGNLPDPDGETGYSDIVRLHIAEWRNTYPGEEPTHMDVLDIGGWTLDGDYFPPEHEWREEIKEVESPDERARKAVET